MKQQRLVIVCMAVIGMCGQIMGGSHGIGKKFLQSKMEHAFILPANAESYHPQPYQYPLINDFQRNAVQSDTLGFSDYDFVANEVQRRTMMYDENGFVHFVYMRRLPTVTTRNVSYVLYQNGLSDGSTEVVSSVDRATGWGTFDLSNNFRAYVAGHGGGAWFSREQTQYYADFLAPTPIVQPDGLGPSIIRDVNNDQILYYLCARQGAVNEPTYIGMYFYKSTDAGSTWSSAYKFNLGPKRDSAISAEKYLAQSHKGTLVIIYTAGGFGALSPIGNATSDAADGLFMMTSTDQGNSWKCDTVLLDGQMIIVHGDTLYPFPQNFGQLQAVYDDSSTLHLVINGYSFWKQGERKDTLLGVNVYPVLYWNSLDRQWREISDTVVSQSPVLDDTNMTNIRKMRPGNGLGLSYPTIAVSRNGKIVFAAWQQPQLDPGQDVLVDVNGIFKTDIVGSYSLNGGKTWKASINLVHLFNSANFPNAAPYIDLSGNSAVVHYVYMIDKLAGVSVFSNNYPNQGQATINPWMYSEYTFTLTGIEPANRNIPSRYSLDQNYPNPFNPTTTIEYRIPYESRISIKVYNLLGQVVGILYEGLKLPGVWSEKWTPSFVSSGIYFYHLDATSVSDPSKHYTATRKMLLIK